MGRPQPVREDSQRQSSEGLLSVGSRPYNQAEPMTHLSLFDLTNMEIESIRYLRYLNQLIIFKHNH